MLVPRLIHAIILSANHVAEMQSMKSCKYRSSIQVNIHINHHNVEKCDLSSLAVGSRLARLRISETSDHPSLSPVSRVSPKKQPTKTIQCIHKSSTGGNALFMITGKWSVWFKLRGYLW